LSRLFIEEVASFWQNLRISGLFGFSDLRIRDDYFIKISLHKMMCELKSVSQNLTMYFVMSITL